MAVSDDTRRSLDRDADGFCRAFESPVPVLSKTSEAPVVAVHGDGTLDVGYGGAVLTVRMTTACSGVAVGDTVLLTAYGQMLYATGVLARDDGHYVKVITQTENISSGQIKVGVSGGMAAVYAYFRTSVQLGGWSNTVIARGLPKPADSGEWASSQVCWQTVNKYNTLLMVDPGGLLTLMLKQEGGLASGQWGFASLAYPTA